MSEMRRSSGSSTARVVLGVLSLLLLIALLLSLFLLGRSVEDAEAEAQTRAVNWTNSVLVGSVSPEQVEEPLTGPEYRDVLIAVQNGISSDERVVRVRIWNTSGGLVFSDDQEDQVGEAVATEDPQIRTALDGQAVSVTSEPTIPAEGGLAGSDDQLYQTYVPFRPDAELGVAGVVEVDQRYDDVVGNWSQTWTAIRFGLGIALALVVVMFLVALRRRPAPVAAGVGTATASPSGGERRVVDLAAAGTAEERVRDLSERLAKAEAARVDAEAVAKQAATHLDELEERVARAEERAANAEAAVQETAKRATGGPAPRRGVPGIGAVAGASAAGELDDKLREGEAERERLTSEVGRLRSALAERDAELALARDEGGTAGAADIDELRRLVAEHEQTAAGADERAAQAERRIGELETELQAAKATIAEAAAAKPRRGHRDRHAEEELHVAQGQATELQTKLAEAEAELEDVRGKLALGDSRASELETANTHLVDELETLRVEAARTDEEVATLRETLAATQRDAPSAEADDRVAAASAALAEAQATLADAQRDRDELLAQLERYREAGEGVGDADVQTLRARVAELEDVRRADVAELQRAQETLANTQFEATQARKQVKDLEQQLQDALGQPVAAAEPAEEVSAPLAGRSRRRAPKHAPAEPAVELEEPVVEAEPAEEEQELSLRERLARAAAARHRMSGPAGSDDR